jgi:hypothetical protein
MSDGHTSERPEPGALGPQTSFQLLDQVKTDLDDVETGLRRLEEGTYGHCEACGGPIDEGRLADLPATRYCVRHQPAAAPPPLPTGPGDSEGGFPLDRVP